MEHARMVAWSGQSWTVKASRTPVGPGPNLFSDSIDNVWVDPVGRLHLKITSRRGRWHAAEVVLGHSLGHGTYRFVLASRLDRFDPNVVAGLFTWSDEPASHHREIDIEFGRWSDAPQCNARYTVQPYDAAGHGHAFRQTAAAPSSHEFRWASDRVSFRSAGPTGQAVANWDYCGPDVPTAGDERTRVNLWLHGGAPPADGAEVELVLDAFIFTGLTDASPQLC